MICLCKVVFAFVVYLRLLIFLNLYFIKFGELVLQIYFLDQFFLLSGTLVAQMLHFLISSLRSLTFCFIFPPIFFSLFFKLGSFYWCMLKFPDCVIFIPLLRPSSESPPHPILYLSFLKFSFDCFSHFLFLSWKMSVFNHFKNVIYLMEYSYNSWFRVLSDNFSICVVSILHLLTFFLSWTDRIVLIHCILRYFGFYPRYLEILYCETPDFIKIL